MGALQALRCNLESAEASYRRAIQLDKHHETTLYNLGVLKAELHDNVAAEELFLKCLHVGPFLHLLPASAPPFPCAAGSWLVLVGEFDLVVDKVWLHMPTKCGASADQPPTYRCSLPSGYAPLPTLVVLWSPRPAAIGARRVLLDANTIYTLCHMGLSCSSNIGKLAYRCYFSITM